MAKAPIPGEVKTRLGLTIGHSAAARIYRAFLLDTISVLDAAAERFSVVAKIVVCPNDYHGAILKPLARGGWTIVCQTRTGLMGGIVDAFDAAFAFGADAALVTDSDSPLALDENIETFVDLASRHDITLGPTSDGGYYIVASRQTARSQLEDLFLGTTYDGATICRATAARASAARLSVGLGPVGFDVDTLDELAFLATRLAQDTVTMLPETRRAIAELELRGAPSAADG
jgi:glycosyltransferase A (GT-A) superfamily protein (DUF2064 family)